jgi:uncharacterized metal-binding protein
MSAGCVHQRASVILAGGFLLGSLVLGGSGLEYAIGSIVGIMVGPDLDVDNGNISNHILKNKIGKWAERSWSLLWYFYRGSIKHGSELSHFPVLSTLGRLAYLYLFILVLPYTLLGLVVPGAWTIGDELTWWNNLIVHHWRMILGLMGSDLIHWALDILTKEHAKKKSMMIFGIPIASNKCKPLLA